MTTRRSESIETQFWHIEKNTSLRIWLIVRTLKIYFRLSFPENMIYYCTKAKWFASKEICVSFSCPLHFQSEKWSFKGSCLKERDWLDSSDAIQTHMINTLAEFWTMRCYFSIIEWRVNEVICDEFHWVIFLG